MASADLIFCSRYPFTKQAKDYVSESGLELTSTLVEKAEARVNNALVTGKVKRVAELPDAREEELAIYAGARMIVSSANNRYIISRYAVAEAKRAGEYLAGDDAANNGHVELVASEFGVRFEKKGKDYLVPLSAYLPFTPRSMDYKLTNRELENGFVLVSRHERIRMMEEAVKKKIEGSLPIRAQFSEDITEAGKRMLALIPKLEVATVSVGQENYPPCIKKMLEDLALSINLPHTARVALGIYLVSAGVTTDKIVDYFRHAPDFSEKTTRYQVEHLRSHKYNMPSCSTMDSYGVCIADCRCGTPLRYRDAINGARLRRLAAEKKE
ncbi:MAG: hypothetical protein NTV88_03530 [Candidatus Micrarchaeota archaeon]|nr:hypothetical protein [Candidatus Micrarchaeota archaeon]